MNKPDGSEQKPNIFEYHDPLVFLKDWLAHRKANRKGFSLRQLAKDAGLAAGYLPMVLAGQRTLSDKAFEKILPHLELSKSEIQVLRHLRTIAEAETPDARLDALSRIQRFQGYKESNTKEVEVYRYLTKWYYVTIREMCLLEDFQEDPEWIQRRLNGRITRSEIEQAVEFLTSNDYLERTKSGRLKVTQKNLDCKEGVFKISLGEFHRQMLGLASDAIDNTPRSERYLLGHTAAIRVEDFDKLKDILSDALAKIEKLASSATKADAVYHVELAAFPTTKKADKSKANKSEAGESK